jgi:diguanylate cyclase (GGDEF)-like protein
MVGRLKSLPTTAILDGAIVSLAAAAVAAAVVALGSAASGQALAPTFAAAAGAVVAGLAFAGWILGLTARRAPRPLAALVDAQRQVAVTSAAASASLVLLAAAGPAGLGAPALALAAGSLAALILRARFSRSENSESYARAREEAQTDALTSLGNRRRLLTDLQTELRAATAQSPRVLVLFDLDGFKRYNDTYGHPAGDALLTRLGHNLARAIGPYGAGYRLGGDEFCVLITRAGAAAKTVIGLSAAALSEHGEGFAIKASYGAVMMPHEAREAAAALRVADQRMYAHKESRRASATRQTRDILLQVLSERAPELGLRLQDVARLARGVAVRLALEAEDVDEVVRAAELHDVGKMAIPDEVLNKPGPLTEEELAFVRQHTVVGERILSAAPALMPVSKLVRSVHERWDGSGYPDGLAGPQIPLGARIVAVCDAFDAMTAQRPHGEAVPSDDAVAELRRCAGSQFDPEVVDAFCAEIAAMARRQETLAGR